MILFHLVDLNWCSLTKWISNYAIETNVSQPCLQKTHLNLNKYPSKLTLLGKSLLEKLFCVKKGKRWVFTPHLKKTTVTQFNFCLGCPKNWMPVASLDAQVVSGSQRNCLPRCYPFCWGANVNYRFFGEYPHFIAWKNRIPWYHPLHDNDIFKLNVSTLMEHHHTSPPIFNLIFGRLRFQSSASLENLGWWSARSTLSAVVIVLDLTL